MPENSTLLSSNTLSAGPGAFQYLQWKRGNEMRRILAVLVSAVLLMNVFCVSAMAASPNEDIVLQLDGGNFKVYRDVRIISKNAASMSRQVASASRAVSQKAAQPAKMAKSVSKKAAQPVKRARSMSRQAKSVARRATEPAKRISRAAQSQKRQMSSISRNAEKLYKDVMRSKSLMEETTPEPVPISQTMIAETEPISQESNSKKSYKYIPVVLALAAAAAGAVLLVKKKADDRREEGEYKSFQ